MPTVQQVVNVLGEFYSRHMADDNWQEFFAANNIAMPTAYLASRGLVIPTNEVALYLNETWNSFCDIFEADPDLEYENLDDFLN